MERKRFDASLLDFLDGDLDTLEEKKFLSLLEEDDELRQEAEQTKQTLQLTRAFLQDLQEPPSSLDQRILAAAREQVLQDEISELEQQPKENKVDFFAWLSSLFMRPAFSFAMVMVLVGATLLTYGINNGFLLKEKVPTGVPISKKTLQGKTKLKKQTLSEKLPGKKAGEAKKNELNGDFKSNASLQKAKGASNDPVAEDSSTKAKPTTPRPVVAMEKKAKKRRVAPAKRVAPEPRFNRRRRARVNRYKYRAKKKKRRKSRRSFRRGASKSIPRMAKPKAARAGGLGSLSGGGVRASSAKKPMPPRRALQAPPPARVPVVKVAKRERGKLKSLDSTIPVPVPAPAKPSIRKKKPRKMTFKPGRYRLNKRTSSMGSSFQKRSGSSRSHNTNLFLDHLNKGKKDYSRRQFRSGINNFQMALRTAVSPETQATAHYELGLGYLNLRNARLAERHFTLYLLRTPTAQRKIAYQKLKRLKSLSAYQNKMAQSVLTKILKTPLPR